MNIQAKKIVVAMMLALSLATTGHAYIALNRVVDNDFQYGLNDNNYGASNGLLIREYWKSDGTGNNRQFFACIRFDLSSVTNPIIAATLRAQQKDVTGYNNSSMCMNLAKGAWTNVTAAMLGLEGMVTNLVTNSAAQVFYKIEPSVP